MYKILLVDDEGIVTDSLQYIIQKYFDGQCNTAVAKNGRQAIEIAEYFRPDIAFLDIQMPGLNGIQAMREIRVQNPQVKAIVLTAYDNVDYVKEALRLGAVDYLTKPIQKMVIVERLTAIMRTVDSERQKRTADLMIMEKMENVLPIIENSFINSIVMQNIYDESRECYRDLLGIEDKFGIIMAFAWSNYKESSGCENMSDFDIWMHSYYDKVVQLIKVHYKAFVSSVMGNKIICVIPLAQPSLENEARLEMIEKAQGLIVSLKRSIGVEVKVGIGCVHPWDDIFKSYQEAINGLRHGENKVTYIEDLASRDTFTTTKQTLEQYVLKAVSKGLEQEVQQEASVLAEQRIKCNPNN